MTAATQRLLRHFRRLAVQSSAEEIGDGDLLERYLTGRDEAAFAALVRRHGPMVLRVCRRMLGDAHAVEDAFQATFLVLARKAAVVRPRAALAGWLYGVARRVALKARASDARRLRREKPAAFLPGADPGPDPLARLSAREVLDALDAEIQRLREVYRLPVVLCCLEGLSHEEAAWRLGWTVGSVRGRLQRGRSQLQHRLVKRGLTLSAALTVALTSHGTAALPATSATATARAAAWADAVVRGMTVSAWKLPALALVLLALTVAAAGSLVPGEDQPAANKPVAVRPGQDPAPRPRLDRHGDPLPPGALARLGTLRFRLGNGIYAMALAPDGKTAVSVGGNSQTHFWDTATGKKTREIAWKEGGGGRVVAYSPDGRTVASVQDYGILHLWDAASGKHLAKLDLNMTHTPCVAFSPDSQIVAAGGFSAKYGRAEESSSTSVVRLWRRDGATLRPLWEAKPDHEAPLGSRSQGIRSLAFSPDGKYLATGGQANNFIRLWKVADGKEVRHFRASGPEVGALAFAPTGNALASGSDNGELALWDPATGTKTWHSKQPGEVRALAFAPDGKTLAVGGGPEYGWRRGKQNEAFLALVDAKDGKEVRRVRTGGDAVASVAFSRDGETLAAGLGGTIRVWDATTGKERSSAIGHEHFVSAVAVSEDGKVVATGGADGAVILWDFAGATEKRRLLGHRAEVRALGFVPGGKLLASAGTDQTVRVWDLATGEQKLCLEGSPKGMIYSLAISPDGKALAAGDYADGSVTAWSVDTGNWVRDFNPGNQVGRGVVCLAFSPDGRILAAGEIAPRAGGPPPRAERPKGRIVCWEAATGRKLAELAAHEHAVNSLAFAADSRTLVSTGWGDQAVRVWDAESGATLGDWPCPDGHGVVTFSPDGKTLGWGGFKGMRLWETATKKVRRDFAGHPAAVHSLAFTPDGRTLVSGSMDTTGLVWDVTGRGPERTAPPALSEDRLRSLWTALGSADAGEAGRAIWSLTADPQRAVPFLVGRLRDLPPITEPKRIPKMVADLDSANFQTRQTAAKELEALGKLAGPALREVLARPASLEVRRRIENVLAKREVPILAPEVVRALRALEALECVGSPAARRGLEVIAKHAAERYIREEANAAAARLAKRGPGPSP
jgi:RNA polymerase sigma factor (sigma-70 family)